MAGKFKFESALVQCPFYHREDTHTLYCEGVVNGSALHVAFDSKRRKDWYEDRYCCKAYRDCRLAEMLYAKYE